MKKISLFGLAITIALSMSACHKSNNQSVNDPNAVAKIGDVVITKSDFERNVEKSMKRYYALGKQGHPAMESRIKSNILRRMTDNIMFQEKAKKLGITVSDEAVNQRFEEQKARFGSEQAFQDYLARTNNTADELKMDVRSNLLREMVIKTMSGEINISNEDVRAYYDANSDRYVEQEEVHARHILVRVEKDKYINNDALKNLAPADREKAEADALAKAREEAMAKIKGIEALVRAPGADFEAIAKEKSEGPTAPKGGDLGFFSRKRMVKEFSDVAFNLQPGEISQVVETRYGLHLIQVIERKAAVRKTFDEVKDGILTSMTNRAKGHNRRQVISQLREEFKPEVFIKFEEEKDNGSVADPKSDDSAPIMRHHHRGPRHHKDFDKPKTIPTKPAN